MKNIKLNEAALATIQLEGEKAYPYECCGFLYGNETDQLREILEAAPVANTYDGKKNRRFSISPLAYQKAELYAVQQGTTLLGIYHSHPDHPSKPSEHDRKLAMPFFSYIIISVKEGNAEEVQSWQLNDTFEFEEERINNQ